MFGRGSNSDSKVPDMSKPMPMAALATPPQQPATPFGMSTPAASAAPPSSVIGTDLAIIGQKITIVSQGRLQVDGEVRGDINGREIVIGQSARVEGTITADAVEVRGEVQGAIRGQSVVLQATARVDGDILHHTLAISEGAVFDGRVRRPKDQSEITPVLDAAQLAAAIAAA